jgi:hypothetical protein
LFEREHASTKKTSFEIIVKKVGLKNWKKKTFFAVFSLATSKKKNLKDPRKVK